MTGHYAVNTDATPSNVEAFDLLRMDRQVQLRQTRRRLVKVAGWTGLIAFAISRGGVLGWLVAGGGMFGLVDELIDWRDERPEWKKHAGPIGGGVVRRLLGAQHPDPVDARSQQSFPASDPPTAAPR